MKREKNNERPASVLNLPNMLTGFNLLSGFLSVVCAAAGRLDLAVLFVLVGMVFDFFDGMTARLLKIQSELGKQLDSLADVVTFGVAPGFIMMIVMMMDVEFYTEQPFSETIAYDFMEHVWLLLSGEINDFVPFVALCIPFFSMLRLGKFNIDTRQTDSFIGLPTPANALFFMGFPLILIYHELLPDSFYAIREVMLNQYFMAISCVVFSLLLISELKLFSLKFKSLRWEGNEVRFIFLLISIALIFVFKVLALPLIVILYLLISIVKHFLTNRNEV